MKTFVSISCLTLALLCGCHEDKMVLPSPATVSTSFGANDTSYVELNPLWDSAYLGLPLAAPADLCLGSDGTLFLADEGANRIHALNKAGRVMSGFGLEQLDDLSAPRGVAIDSKLNLLVVNGTNKLYIWNQFLNRVQIDSVAESGLYWDRNANALVTLTLAEYRQRLAEGADLRLRRYLFRSDPALIAAATTLRLAYADAEAASVFNGVAAGKYGEESIYLTDSANDRIIQLLLVPELACKTRERYLLYSYTAVLQKSVAVYGSGSGTVDDPYAIATDSEENLYFTQLGGNFRLQRLNALTFAPRYVLYQHEIMDLDRFRSPYDVAMDEAGSIFVLDGDEGTVAKFANSGMRAGQQLSLGKKGLALARFNQGRGLLVSENVVYVVEQGARCIRRFQYSVSDSDIPDDEKKP